MASTKEQRVDDALQQLVSRLIPPDATGDESEEERRWDESISLARRILDSEQPSASPSDTSQAADLIRTKLLRDSGRPDRATKFSNLYSRLLQQPVLGQKWAILYFLYKLAEPDTASLQQRLERIGEVGGAGHVQRAAATAANGTHERQGPSHRAARGSEVQTDMVSSRESMRERIFSPAAESARQQYTAAGGRVRSPPPTSPVPGARREILAARPPSKRQRELGAESAAIPPSTPTETQLLRDLPFALQGVSSTHLPFKDVVTLRLPDGLPVPIISLLHALAEPSLLYKSLAKFVEANEGGLIGQSLRSAIGEELRSYLGLVATLEGQIRKALSQIGDDASRQNLARAGVTLKRCVVWTKDATLGLRLMSTIAEDSAGKKGGKLISLLHSLSTDHGDPFVHLFASRLLHTVTDPFYSMLQHWVFSGDLQDPYYEFFVKELPDGEDSTPSSIWTDKYQIDKDLIPTIISSELAQRIFLIGKSLNFIRSSCSDSAWVESYTASATRKLSFSDPEALSEAIDEAYKVTTAHVIELMSKKFSLFEHLSALKKYLLLGQGDFIAILLESLAGNLDGPANSQYRHHLTSALDHSIRNSNAQYEPQDITRRLDARMLELSHGEIGWDVFTLEYRMDSPLDVVVGPWAQKQYLKIFNFLWRIKRVEFTLSKTWGRCMTGSRGVLKFVGEKGRPAKDDKVDPQLKETWKRARGGLAAMVHFVGQLQYYILFEVIESGWEKLMAEIAKPSATLDTLITAHTTYLHSITRKGLLAPSSSSSSSSSSTPSNQSASTLMAHTADFTSQLHELLKLMLAYKDATEALYSHSVAEFTRAQDRARRADKRTAAGGWGLTESDDRTSSSSAAISPLIRIPGEDDDGAGGGGGGGAVEGSLDAIHRRLVAVETDFTAKVNVLLGDLAYQQDSDMRFLGVVMNFNDAYRPVRRRRHGHGHGHGHGRERDKEREKEKERDRDRGKEQGQAQEKAAGEAEG